MRRCKIILVIASLVSGIASHSFAQEPAKNILSINPIGISLLGVHNVEFERVLSPYSPYKTKKSLA